MADCGNIEASNTLNGPDKEKIIRNVIKELIRTPIDKNELFSEQIQVLKDIDRELAVKELIKDFFDTWLGSRAQSSERCSIETALKKMDINQSSVDCILQFLKTEQGMHYPVSKEKLIDLLEKCKKLNIEFIGRFPYDTLKGFVENRLTSQKDNRPLVVVIYPKKDWNGAFYGQSIVDFVNHGYRVMYYEVNTDKEMIQSLKDVTQDQQAALLI